jgi:hypothetical protein
MRTHMKCWTRTCQHVAHNEIAAPKGVSSRIELFEVRMTGNVAEVRPSMAASSSFNRLSMNWRSRSERLVLSNLRYRLMLLPCARILATFGSIIGRLLVDIKNRSNVLGNPIVPLFGLFNPKRSILILKLRTLTAESRHSAAICKRIHINPPTNNPN